MPTLCYSKKILIFFDLGIPSKTKYYAEMLLHCNFIKSKNPVKQNVNRVFWYSRWESNPHFRRNWILNPARLPIPPLEHLDRKNIYIFHIIHKNTRQYTF